MEIGKVSEVVLKRSVFRQLTVKREEVLVGPLVGEDCSVLQLREDELCVLSCDPITGTVHEIGNLAVQITANDIAASGAEPVGILLTALLPEGFLEADLKKIMKDVNTTCEALNIQVLGGHTEVTKAVNQPVLSVTGFGKIKKEVLLNKEAINAGQEIVLTKWIGLEGTAILAKAKEEQLKAHYNYDFVEGAKSLGRYLSVIPESKIAMEQGVTFMHDVTEGGIFGALWELSSNTGKGIEIQIDRIPVRQETVEICDFFDLNPYKLISSGSMIIVTPRGEALVKALRDGGIEANVIGHLTDNNDKTIIQEDTRRSLEPPKSDELYKAL